jgi:hypothetical protein
MLRVDPTAPLPEVNAHLDQCHQWQECAQYARWVLWRTPERRHVTATNVTAGDPLTRSLAVCTAGRGRNDGGVWVVECDSTVA